MKIMKGAEPFFKKGNSTGILLLHGYTSSPQEVEYLSEYLAKRGFTVYAPLIKGHGTTPKHLSKTKKEDWINSAEQALLRLKKITKKQIVVGSSFGGNLAVLLENKYEIHGLALLGTGFTYRRTIKNLAFRVLYPFVGFFKESVRKEYNDHEKKLIKKKIQYLVIPIKPMRSFFWVGKRSKRLLRKIKTPVLLMEAEGDTLINPKNLDHTYKLIKNKNKQKILLPYSYHVFLMDKHKQKAAEHVLDFIDRCIKMK